ncbi:DUF3995 domain-containing protein [Streptomyces sp. NPDC018833]|uniref:DUF3995 domain-containing protein n=1 Tax=Streptomyces sp. NPDC018833 TaxID=3365053 RepID=UPI0037BAA29D
MVPTTLASVLAAIGCLHVVWIFTPWPLQDAETLARTLVGEDSGQMPPDVPTALVGAALIGGAVLTLMVSEHIPGIGPERLRRLGIHVLAGVMFLRGLGGYFMNSDATSEFQTWNSALYSPLCIGLGLLAVTVGLAAPRRARELSPVTE